MLDTTETNRKVGGDRNMNGSDSSMTAIVGDVAEAVGYMATLVERQAGSTVRYGYDTASRMIRKQPITAVAVSVGAGMLLAMLLTRSSSEKSSSGESWAATADRMASSAGNMASTVSHTAQSAVQSAREAAAPVLPAIERVVDTISDMKGLPAPLSGIASIWQAVQGRGRS